MGKCISQSADSPPVPPMEHLNGSPLNLLEMELKSNQNKGRAAKTKPEARDKVRNEPKGKASSETVSVPVGWRKAWSNIQTRYYHYLVDLAGHPVGEPSWSDSDERVEVVNQSDSCRILPVGWKKEFCM